MQKRYGRQSAIISFIEPAILYLSIASFLLYLFYDALESLKNGFLIGIAILGIWRYGLLIINFIRAIIYARYTYPNYQKQISNLSFEDKFPDTIYFIIPSYKEDEWVSTEVFKALITEVNSLPCKSVIAIATSNDIEDSVILNIFDSHPNTDKIQLIFQKQHMGKRIAMGHSLRAISREYNKHQEDESSVTIFMDGDTYIPKDTLKKSLPFFKIDSNLGAVTTNETGYIESKSLWYKDWFTLKFAQRHFLFQSHSLSKRVLTLTGRFSLFRTSIVIREDFISLIENDIILDPNFGKFRFLMGDDKSSWFYMMKHGYNLLYLPDVLAYSLESRDGNFLEISRTLPYRWYGNTLRNNKRARALKNQPLFIKYLFYDQLALMWTSIAGVTTVIFLSLFKSIFYLPLYISWILYVRTFQMALFSYLGHRVSIRTIPLMLYGQWYGSYVKIRSFFNLTDQKWSKAGGEVQTADDDTAPIKYKIATHYSVYRMYLYIFIFLFTIATVQTNLLKVPSFELLSSPIQSQKIIMFELDRKKNQNAQSLNRIIENAPNNSIIQLPNTTIDFYKPIVIRRSNLTIRGDNTVLSFHLSDNDTEIIQLAGKKGKNIGHTSNPLKNNIKFQVVSNEVIYPKEILLLEDFNNSKIIEVSHYENNTILMQFLSKNNLDKKATLTILLPVNNITLQNLSLQSDSFTINGISMKYATYIHLNNIHLNLITQYPLKYNYTYNTYANNININIYKKEPVPAILLFSKSFHNNLYNVSMKNIKQIQFTNSSSNNKIEYIQTNSLVNLTDSILHDNITIKKSY